MGEVKGGHKIEGTGQMRRQGRVNEIPKTDLHLLSKAFSLKASLMGHSPLLRWSWSRSSSGLPITTQMAFPITACCNYNSTRHDRAETGASHGIYHSFVRTHSRKPQLG